VKKKLLFLRWIKLYCIKTIYSISCMKIGPWMFTERKASICYHRYTASHSAKNILVKCPFDHWKRPHVSYPWHASLEMIVTPCKTSQHPNIISDSTSLLCSSLLKTPSLAVRPGFHLFVVLCLNVTLRYRPFITILHTHVLLSDQLTVSHT
jgi:hypothetical protein